MSSDTRLFHYAVGACVGVAILAGCGGQQPPIGAPGTMAQVATAQRPTPVAETRDLFVNDVGHNAVEILANSTWKNVGAITDGIDEPDDNWVDNEGRLYVTNLAGGPTDTGTGVTEYDRSGSLIYTYDGCCNPNNVVAVSTDAHNHVFVADGYYGVIEYVQQSGDDVLGSCSVSYYEEGVAVDKSGDVFVDYNASGKGAGKIIEFRGGLAGCKATNLGVTLSFAGGLALDKQNDIIVCDQRAKSVDVIAPPYAKITRTLGRGYSDPLHVSINRRNDRAYVTDVGTWTVRVLDYPSGSKIATLNRKNGLELATSAVDRSNYVP